MTIHQGSCHCGRIAFEVEGDFTSGIDCNCSLCRKRGGLLAFAPAAALNLKTPREDLSTYRFNTHKIAHHFCNVCGIAPFGEGTAPDGSTMVALNLRCLPDIDLSTLEIHPYDGQSV